MCDKIFINSFGLILDIVGVLFLYKFAVTRLIGRGGQLQNTPDGLTDPTREKVINKHKSLEKLGIILIILGFVFQLVSNFVP